MIKSDDVSKRIADYALARVEADYERILDKLKDSNIYGQRADLDDPKMLVVAAYHLGRDEEANRAIYDLEEIHKLMT